METYDLISVIIPAYNKGNISENLIDSKISEIRGGYLRGYLARCIESLQQQTYQNIEIIIVDDGSADDTFDVAMEYSKTDMRIRVVKLEHGGVSKARNKGLELAKGEYIMFADADDYYDSEAIKILYELITSSGTIDISIGRALMETERRISPIHQSISDEPILTTSISNKEMLKQVLDGQASTACWAKLYKRSVAFHNFPELVVGEDGSWFVDALLKSEDIIISSQTIYHYIQHNGGARIRPFCKEHFDELRSVKYIESSVNAYSELYKDMQSFKFDRYIGTLSRIYVWGKDKKYQKQVKVIEKTIARARKEMNKDVVPLSKRMAWSMYRFNKTLFRIVMRRYYNNSLYKSIHEAENVS